MVNSRRKGHDFERHIALWLRKFWPGAKRGLGQARDGSEVCDVEETPYWVECKRGRAVNVRAAMKQAEEATDGRKPIVVHKSDNGPTLVTMKLEHWLEEICEDD